MKLMLQTRVDIQSPLFLVKNRGVGWYFLWAKKSVMHEYMIPIVFGGGQWSCEVTRGQKVETL